MKIKDLQKDEKPREKLQDKGPDSLTDVELIAVILRSGGKNESVMELSRELINAFKGIKGLLSADIEELIKFKNIDIAKATSIKALEEISKRYLDSDKTKGVHIKTPKDIFDLVRKEILNKDQEYLFLISLDTRNKLISKE